MGLAGALTTDGAVGLLSPAFVAGVFDTGFSCFFVSTILGSSLGLGSGLGVTATGGFFSGFGFGLGVVP